MQRWRCIFCGDVKNAPLEFASAAERPKCPRCSRGGTALVPLTDVHFLYPDPSGPIMGLYELRYRVACMPGLAQPNGQAISDFTPAVTCPRCLQHPKFREYQVQNVVSASGNILTRSGWGSGCCGD